MDLQAMGQPQEKKKKISFSVSLVLFSLADGRQYKEENDERNRGKTSKRKRIE
jgi:hypothetical protein